MNKNNSIYIEDIRESIITYLVLGDHTQLIEVFTDSVKCKSYTYSLPEIHVGAFTERLLRKVSRVDIILKHSYFSKEVKIKNNEIILNIKKFDVSKPTYTATLLLQALLEMLGYEHQENEMLLTTLVGYTINESC